MIKSLFDEFNDPQNQLNYSNFGYYPALCYKGTPEFIKHITNLIYNYSIIKNGDIYNYSEGKYVLSPEERVLNGLLNQFKNEIILNHELYDIDYKCEIDENEEIQLNWNEDKINEIATQLTNKFWTEKVSRNNIFQYYKSEENYNEFTLGKIEETNKIEEN